MTTFDDAKAEFKKHYKGAGYELTSEGEKTLEFKMKHTRYKITEEEIEEYRRNLELFPDVVEGQNTTSLTGKNFHEQYVDYVRSSRLVMPSNLDKPYIFASAEGGVSIQIGAASEIFRNFFRLNKAAAGWIRDRTPFGLTGMSGGEALLRLRTIRLETSLPMDSLQMSNVTAMFESCLFELSYMSGVHLEIRNEWSVSRRQIIPPNRRTSSRTFPFKRVKYDTAVIRFYQRAAAIDDPYIQFISFYHVLEYYFVSVSDRILYGRLSQLLIDPAFRPIPKHLDKIITATADHKRGNDETEMLKNVLSAYVSDSDVVEFMEDQESRTPIYSTKSSCFGEELDKINIKEGHIFTPISKRIKTIRNTLVHSSDRYDRKDRYLPGIEADRTLRREIPLLKFLAERVIIATAQALPD